MTMPEIAAGAAADVRSDQFAFAVSLFEALHGRRPPADNAPPAGRGGDRPRRSAPRIPRWLEHAVRRGLSGSPGARWPSMREMLDALTPPAGRTRAAAWTAGVLAVLAVVVVVVATTRPSAPLCSGGAAAWGAAWNGERSGQLAASFRAAGGEAASFTLRAVAHALDEERDRWIAMHRDACEATRVRGEQPERVLGLRMRCLEDRRREIDALVGVLARAAARRATGGTATDRRLLRAWLARRLVAGRDPARGDEPAPRRATRRLAARQ
jgi:eukaryotic-like serine/threonine-protein kinase